MLNLTLFCPQVDARHQPRAGNSAGGDRIPGGAARSLHGDKRGFQSLRRMALACPCVPIRVSLAAPMDMGAMGLSIYCAEPVLLLQAVITPLHPNSAGEVGTGREGSSFSLEHVGDNPSLPLARSCRCVC